jgi:hypothetical protein
VPITINPLKKAIIGENTATTALQTIAKGKRTNCSWALQISGSNRTI